MACDLKLTGAGEVLRDLREKAGFGLREAAEELHWDPGLLSRYEKGQVGVTLEIVEQIADLVKKPREAVVLECLKARYKKLAKKESPIGRALGHLLNEIDKNAD